MKKLFGSLLVVLCVLGEVVANASTVNATQNEFAASNAWSSASLLKEDKKENGEMFSSSAYSRYDHMRESKEEHRFNFDGEDRWHYRIEYCDKPAPIPVPASLWLLASGFIGLLKFRRITR